MYLLETTDNLGGEILLYGGSVFGVLILLIFLILIYEKITNMRRERAIDPDEEKEYDDRDYFSL